MPLTRSKAEVAASRSSGAPDEAGNSYLEKVFAALEAISSSDGPVSLSEVTARLGIPKPSVHRILAQLEQAHLIKRDLAGKRFLSGERATRLAYTTLQSAARTANELVLRGLVSSIGETFNISILDGAEIVYVHRVECDWPLRSHYTAGSRFPAHCTSAGKAILAFSSKEVRKQFIDNIALKRFTSNTISSRTKFIPMLDRVKRDGFAQNDQEYIDGVVGIAVPILGKDGRALAGLSLHAPLARLSLRQAREHVPEMKQAARKLAALIS